MDILAGLWDALDVARANDKLIRDPGLWADGQTPEWATKNAKMLVEAALHNIDLYYQARL